MFYIRKFGDLQLERLYYYKQLNQYAVLITHALCIFTAAFLLVALNHLLNPDLVLVWATVSATCALSLNILINVLSTTKNKHTAIILIACWLCILTLCSIFARQEQSLMPSIISTFTIYTLFPFQLFTTIMFATIISIAQIIAFILTSTIDYNEIVVEQLLATIIIHAWTNFIGIYIFTTRNRLSRAAFLNARNALTSQKDAIEQNSKMNILLSSSLPQHVITSVQNQINVDISKIYVEHYTQAIVIYAKIYSLQSILNQISVQDSARLLNELDYRIDRLVKRYNFIRIQSDAIVVVAGVPQSFDNPYTLRSCYFSQELNAVFKSFCDATTADVQLKIGIGNGLLTCGIVGARKWHYDVIGAAYDLAKNLELKSQLNCILISEEIKSQVEHDFVVECVDYGCWAILQARNMAPLSHSLLFATTQRCFSVAALPQAINRLLQSSAVLNANTLKKTASNDHLLFKYGSNARRHKKRNTVDLIKLKNENMNSSFNADDDYLLMNDSNVTNSSINSCKKNKNKSLINLITMRFTDPQLEQTFYAQIDRWFIPALAINILFLFVYGIYQMLVLSRILSTFILIIIALCLLFIILLMLYVNYFESFGQFITRTFAGHTTTIVLIIAILFVCGIVNTFSCGSFIKEQFCREVYYLTISCVLWMITTVVFIRFSSFYLLISLIVAILFYLFHVFESHANYYLQFSTKAKWQHMEFDLIISLFTLALIIYLQSRRNERLIRIDYLSILKTFEENHRLERIEFLNYQIVTNALPAHIVPSYLAQTDLYHNLCQNVGVLSAKFGQSSDWQTECDFDRLNRIIFEIDQLKFIGVEKVRSTHCIYTCAVGILPEIFNKNEKNVPYTISELFVSITNFALKLKQIAVKENLDLAIGIDCGSALSLVIGQNKPRYELIGAPCVRSLQLMSFVSAFKVHNSKNAESSFRWQILASEEIFLTLRLKQNGTALFYFDERNLIHAAPGLVGYTILENTKPTCDATLCYPIKQQKTEQKKQQICPHHQCFTQQKNFNADLPNNQLYKNQKLNLQSLAQNKQQETRIVGIATPIKSSSSTVMLKNLSMKNNSILNNAVHSFIDNSEPLRHSVSDMSKSLLENTFEQNTNRHSYLCYNEVNNIQNKFNNLSSIVSMSSISETDFDEIDESVAAEVCAREKNSTKPLQLLNNSAKNINNLLVTLSDDDSDFKLPTNFKDLTNDKRLSVKYDNCKNINGMELHENNNWSKNSFKNPFEMFASMNSSFSSEIYSIDVSIESDSEIEWITPKMIAANNNKNNNFKKSDNLLYNKKSNIKNKESSSIINQHYNNNNFGQNQQHSEQFLENEYCYQFPLKTRRKKLHLSRNGPKLPSWFNSSSRNSFTSQLSISKHSHNGSITALERLNAAARRVDQMLAELACVDSNYINFSNKQPDCARFPTTSANGSLNALIELGHIKSLSRRDNNSTCLTDYDNAESEDFYSDSELLYNNNSNCENSKIIQQNKNIKQNLNNKNSLAHKLKQAFSGVDLTYESNNFLPKQNKKLEMTQKQLPPVAPNSRMRRLQCNGLVISNGKVSIQAYEGDIDSNCSSIVSSQMFLNSHNKVLTQNDKVNLINRPKWKSAHSIGYDNEYEFASESEYYDSSDYDISGADLEIKKINQIKSIKVLSDSYELLGAFDPTKLPAFKNDCKIIAMNENIDHNNEHYISSKKSNNNQSSKTIDARYQVQALSRDICQNYGDYKLASFSDIDA